MVAKVMIAGWIITGIIAAVFIGALVTNTKILFIDCKDGGPLTFNKDDCSKLWCSALNKRVDNITSCPNSKCADGEETFNLYYCKKYPCPDGSQVDSPEKCNKFACADGSKTDNPKNCKEYCQSATDCNPTKAQILACFGDWICASNQCKWQCDPNGNFTNKTPKEIALSLTDLVNEGYAQIGEEKETDQKGGKTYSFGFESARNNIKLTQSIAVQTEGIQKIQLANTFNKYVNDAINNGAIQFDKFNLGEDSFAIEDPKQANVYAIVFRKLNVLVSLIITTDTNENAKEAIQKYGSIIESRITQSSIAPVAPFNVTPQSGVICNSSDPTKWPVIAQNISSVTGETPTVKTVNVQNSTGGTIEIVALMPANDLTGDFKTLNTGINPSSGLLANGVTLAFSPICDDGTTICKTGYVYNGTVTVNYKDQYGYSKAVTITCQGIVS